jgi:hypothetical protein
LDNESSQNAGPAKTIADTTLPCFVNRTQLFGNNFVREFTFVAVTGIDTSQGRNVAADISNTSEKVSNLSMTDTTKVATIPSASAQVQVKSAHANTNSTSKRRRNNFIGPVIDLTNED